MKRARLSLEADLREKEKDMLLRAQIMDEAEKELRDQATQRQQDAMDEVLRGRIDKWDQLQLVSAREDALVRPPPVLPTQGSLLLL